ncbi:MAG: hypothetical protein WKG01_28280 [Kofleriaceae bacterium]
MKTSRRVRERGNAMLLAMIVLTALATLSSLTVVSVQGGIATTSNDRFHNIAIYAAESGGAVAMDFLRRMINSTTGWTAYISASNTNPPQPNMPGNNIQYGQPGTLMSADQQGWYSISILNNRSDPGFVGGTDTDKRVVIRVTGYGPNGSVAILEWDVTAANVTGVGRPCPSYAQRGMSEDGAGRNDCLGAINTGDTATFRPGG